MSERLLLILSISIFLLKVVPVDAQSIKVSGTVSDAAGLPVAGATVFEKDNMVAVSTTNEKGSFTITCRKNGVLVVSCTGYYLSTSSDCVAG